MILIPRIPRTQKAGYNHVIQGNIMHACRCASSFSRNSMDKGRGSSSTSPVLSQCGELERRLNLFDATMIIVGNIIGIGIFTTTGLIAEALPDAMMMIWVWIIGGLLTLCGALTYAERGAARPRAGGEYVDLKAADGPVIRFLHGWTC